MRPVLTRMWNATMAPLNAELLEACEESLEYFSEVMNFCREDVRVYCVSTVETIEASIARLEAVIKRAKES